MAKNFKTKFELEVIHLIREKRIELNLSQDDIAFYLNVTRGFIGQIESPKNPAKYNLNHIAILAGEFGCSPQDLIPKDLNSKK